MAEEKIDITPKKDGGVLKKILREGTSDEQPGSGDKVTVHYVGTLEDGTKFDSSHDRNSTFDFDLGKGSVIKGWDLGVATMKRGELAEFTIKAEYAYGNAGSPPKIPGGATLIFEVELFDWKGEDLSKDKNGGIIRSILVRGSGYTTPNDGAGVDIHLVGTYNGTVFEDRDVSYEIGEGFLANVVDGVDIALRKFKKGERSRLTLQPSYAFGSDGCPEKNIPPNAEVTFEVTLKEFVKAKESWQMESTEKLEQSELFKEKGTKQFKEGSYKVAIRLYRRVIDFLKEESDFKGAEAEKRNSLLSAAHLNVAMCALKLNFYFEAAKQCTEALELSPGNVKGLFRRGQARINLQDYDEAISDFQAVLEKEPENKAAKNQLVICRQKKKEVENKEKKKYAGMFQKFAEEDAKKHAKGGFRGDGLDKLGDWDNKMAEDMLPLDKEMEAFGETMPEAQYNKEECKENIDP